METTSPFLSFNDSATTCADVAAPWCGDNTPAVDVLIDIFLWFLSAFTILGNALVLAVFIKDRELRSKVSNLYILNLAIADLLVGCISVPIHNLYRSNCWWTFSRAACRFWVTMDFSECTVSVWAIVLISYDRFLLVTKGLEYAKYQTLRKFLILSALLWSISYIRYFFSYVVYDWIVGSTVNYDCECRSDLLSNQKFLIYDVLTSNTIPIIFIVYFNASLYINIRKRSLQNKRRPSSAEVTSTSRPISTISLALTSGGGENGSSDLPKTHLRLNLQRHRKAALTLAVLVIVACLCWIPYFTVSLLGVTSYVTISTRAFIISYYIFYANSAINPLLYVATNPRIRKGVFEILKFDCQN